MAYTIHITRKENHFDREPIITDEEWNKVVNEDETLKALPGNSVSFSGNQIPIVTWTDDDTGTKIDMYLYDGNIEIDGPNENAIEKLKEIATRLSAKVQGDDLEIY